MFYPRISQSAFSSYNYCPRLFYLKYIQRIKPPQTQSQTRGSIIHNVIKNFLKNPSKREDLLREYNLLTKDNGNLEKSIVDIGYPLLTLWLKEMYKRGYFSAKILSLEESFERWYKEGFVLVGTPDVVFDMGNEIHIIDWKTQRGVPSEEKIIDNFQFRCYANITDWGKDVVFVAWYFRYNRIYTFFSRCEDKTIFDRRLFELFNGMINGDFHKKTDCKPEECQLGGFCEG